jgi:ketosteroid isomerase-like protein
LRVDSRELIVACLEAANRNEMDAAAALVHADFIGVVPANMSAEPDTYEGPEGLRRYFDLFREIVDELEFSITNFEDVGDWTIALGAAAGTGRVSGIRLMLDVAIGTQVRDGKLFRMEAFPDLEHARRELGAR